MNPHCISSWNVTWIWRDPMENIWHKHQCWENLDHEEMTTWHWQRDRKFLKELGVFPERAWRYHLLGDGRYMGPLFFLQPLTLMLRPVVVSLLFPEGLIDPASKCGIALGEGRPLQGRDRDRDKHIGKENDSPTISVWLSEEIIASHIFTSSFCVGAGKFLVWIIEF